MGCSGCCGHCNCHGHGITKLSDQEGKFLMDLAQTPFLPLARLTMSSTRSDDLQSVALEPFWLIDGQESMEQVNENRELLLGLEEKGFISLDYDQPLQGCGYDAYLSSSVYKAFQAAVEEGGKREGFLFDTPNIELGSLALTSLGQQAVETLETA